VYVRDTTKTWFSIYDGSTAEVSLVSQSELEKGTVEGYDSAYAQWSNGDDVVMGEIEYYLPTHPDTCVLIERVTVRNNTDTTIWIHVGEAIDWEISQRDTCYADTSRQEVYVCGTPGVSPEEGYCGGAGWCHDIPGDTVVDNATFAWEPAKVGGLVARLRTHEAYASDEASNLVAVYTVDKYARLEPDSFRVYCKVKTSSLNGIDEVKTLIDKGKQWISDHELVCPEYGPYCDADPGDPNEDLSFDIDDVVYLIAYVFSGGPPPKPYDIASGDPNCSCGVDIDDIVYLIAYIFSGGPAPCVCEHWILTCGLPLR
jgi:hypothetical protein